MNSKSPLGCTPASAVRGYILEALDASNSYDLTAVPGLPPGSIVVPECDVIIAATTAPEPCYRSAVERVATERSLDVVLLRIGCLEDALIRVDVDLTLAALPGIWVENGLRIWTDYRTRWLVPAGFGASVLISPDGLQLDLTAPFDTLAQRDAGIARAEHEMARLLDPVRVS
jgi:hypothetical protein